MFESQCQAAHAKLVAGKCPWCGRLVVYGRPMPPQWASERRLIRFEFHGGCKNGDVITGRLTEPPENAPLLWRYLYFTEGGRVGARFDEVVPYIPSVEENLMQDKFNAISDAAKSGDPKAIVEAAFAPTPPRRFGAYEVTQRDESEDQIRIRLDFVEEPAPE
jgi:hypothetical protein